MGAGGAARDFGGLLGVTQGRFPPAGAQEEKNARTCRPQGRVLWAEHESIPAVGFDRGTTTQAAKRSAVPADSAAPALYQLVYTQVFPHTAAGIYELASKLGSGVRGLA